MLAFLSMSTSLTFRLRTGTEREQMITKLSLAHQILSPYTAFIAVQAESSSDGTVESIVRHVPIQTVLNPESVSSMTARYEANALVF